MRTNYWKQILSDRVTDRVTHYVIGRANNETCKGEPFEPLS